MTTGTSEVWEAMSDWHLRSAEFFAERAAVIEQASEPGAHHAHYEEHRSYVVGAVLCSAAHLEALVNEVLAAARDSRLQRAALPISAAARRALQDLSRADVSRKTLSKYGAVLAAAHLEAFPHGEEPYLGAARLLRLRNRLAHYSPKWMHVPFDEATDLPVSLRSEIEKEFSGLFDQNGLAGSRYGFWPHRCLGAGCAAWSVVSARAFGEAFKNRLGIRAGSILA